MILLLPGGDGGGVRRASRALVVVHVACRVCIIVDPRHFIIKLNLCPRCHDGKKSGTYSYTTTAAVTYPHIHLSREEGKPNASEDSSEVNDKHRGTPSHSSIPCIPYLRLHACSRSLRHWDGGRGRWRGASKEHGVHPSSAF